MVSRTSSSTWALVATIDEPPALVQAFVAWHLKIGAQHIYLYFDRPDDPAAELVSDMPNVTVVRCDNGYWLATSGGRSSRHQKRQVVNANHAYAQLEAGWLLHADADEYVWQDAKLSDVLGNAAPEVDFVRLMNVERMYRAETTAQTIFEGFFRKPYFAPADRAVELFGEDFLSTSRGLTGHSVGKSLTRAGLDLSISIHKPRASNKTANEALVPLRLEDPKLLHFDGLTPFSWVYKLLRKADAVANFNGAKPSPHRQRQVDAVLAAASDPAAAMALHDRLKCADETRAAELYWMGLSVDLPFDPQPALAKVFPGQSVDLSPEAIDDWYWSQKGAVMSQFGLTR
jgi:hypothetical protein